MSGTKTFVHKNPLRDGAGRGLEMSTPRQAEQSTFEFPTCIKLPLVQKEVREVLLYLFFYHEKSAWSHKPTRVKLCWLFTTARVPLTALARPLRVTARSHEIWSIVPRFNQRHTLCHASTKGIRCRVQPDRRLNGGVCRK